MIDVVYTVGKGSRWEDNELRFSLRALERNARGVGRVIVVGHLPSWCAAEHIQADDIYPKDKDANMIHKVRVAIEHGVTERFLYAHDDQYLLRPVDLTELPAWHKGDLSECNSTDLRYRRRVRNTRRLLDDSGYSTLNYDLHAPMLFEAALFIMLFGRLRWWHQPGGPGIVVKSMYGNSQGIAGTHVSDLLLYPYAYRTRDDIIAATATAPFCSTRQSVHQAARDFLAARFPKPSKWECDEDQLCLCVECEQPFDARFASRRHPETPGGFGMEDKSNIEIRCPHCGIYQSPEEASCHHEV